MFEVEGFSRRQIIPLVLVLVIGYGLGWLGFMVLGDFAGNIEISYVSKAEILGFEKDRLKQEEKEAIIGSIREDRRSGQTDKGEGEKGLAQGRIFYGMTNEAVRLIEEAAKARSGGQRRVIFVNDEFVKGDGATSISFEVYDEVMGALQDYLKEGAKK